MSIWVRQYEAKLPCEDRKILSLLIELREISSHDLLLRPDLDGTSVDVSDVRTLGAGSISGNLAYQHDFGSPDAENVIQSAAVSANYVFQNHGSRHVMSFCDDVVRILKKMVDEAYADNP